MQPTTIKRVLLIATFRSGSSFLGDLLQQSSLLTYYHYEPLACLAYHNRFDGDRLPEAKELIQNLFTCNFTRIQRYTSFWPSKLFFIGKNQLNQQLCGKEDAQLALCTNAHLSSEICRRSHVQTMKLVRLNLRDLPKIDLLPRTKIVYLRRDPRAIYNSRKELW